MWVRTPLRRGVLDTILCYEVCPWLAAGQRFSPGTCHLITNNIVWKYQMKSLQIIDNLKSLPNQTIYLLRKCLSLVTWSMTLTNTLLTLRLFDSAFCANIGENLGASLAMCVHIVDLNVEKMRSPRDCCSPLLDPDTTVVSSIASVKIWGCKNNKANYNNELFYSGTIYIYQGHLAVKKIPESIQKSTPYKVIPSAI